MSKKVLNKINVSASKNKSIGAFYVYMSRSLNFVKKKAKVIIKTALDCLFQNIPFSGYVNLTVPFLLKQKNKVLEVFFKKSIINVSNVWLIKSTRQKKKTIKCFLSETKMIFSLIGSVVSKIIYASIGSSEKLMITGYARKAWITKSKAIVYFKVGQSYVNKVSIPRRVRLFLFKKRSISLFSSNKRCLTKIAKKIFFLRKSDDYTGEGIQLLSSQSVLKSRFSTKKN